MNSELIFITTIFVAMIIAVFYFMGKKADALKREIVTQKSEDKSILLLQQQMGQLMGMMDKKLSETNLLTKEQLSDSNQFMKGVSRESRELLGEINRQFSEMNKHSQKTIEDVARKLTKLDETNQRVVDFSSQLKDLQDILKNPKQRGVLGEYYLEETLKNVLAPSNYQVQYKFKDGTIVDAVIFVKDKIIPIDSKFSLEAYEQLLNCKDPAQRDVLEKKFKQDLKIRIDETSKYVKPGENTVDFAFMFIPSESIYYDLLVNKIGAVKVSSRDLIEYAFREKHVIIVSPTSFLAYLQTVLQGLRALQIEESAKMIQKNVEKLSKHLQVYQTYHNKIGSTLNTTVNHYNKATKEFKKVNKDVVKITEGKGNESKEAFEEVIPPKI